jgi:hypothetical protein
MHIYEKLQERGSKKQDKMRPLQGSGFPRVKLVGDCSSVEAAIYVAPLPRLRLAVFNR